MKFEYSHFSRTWDLGEWSISHDVRHGQYDVCKRNLHYLCTCRLACAVQFVLLQQGWTDLPCIEKVAEQLSEDLERIELTAAKQ